MVWKKSFKSRDAVQSCSLGSTDILLITSPVPSSMDQGRLNRAFARRASHIIRSCPDFFLTQNRPTCSRGCLVKATSPLETSSRTRPE